ncbi:hypothetical protein R75483_02702 [Paraburkholderia domus]|nr:hypothetical protein R75483_02702 [Paraburkholderia domus]
MNAHPNHTTFSDELTDLIARLHSFGSLADARHSSLPPRASLPEKCHGVLAMAEAPRAAAIHGRNSPTLCPLSIRRLCAPATSSQVESEVDSPDYRKRPGHHEVNPGIETTVSVSCHGRLLEVTVLTLEILRERDWRQPSDWVCSWSTVFSNHHVFRRVSTRQAFEHAVHHLASLPASVVKAYNDAYLDYQLTPCTEHGRANEAKRLRESLKIATTWTELRVRVRPVFDARQVELPHQGVRRSEQMSRVRILDNSIPRHTEKPCSDDSLTWHRPPYAPRPNLKNANGREALAPAQATNPSA